MISELRENFVNVWLLAKELDAIAAASDDADVKQLCALIADHYEYPVDSVLISPELEVLDHVNAHDHERTTAGGYLAFLRGGVARARGEPVDAEAGAAAARQDAGGDARAVRPPMLTVTPDEPQDSILDLVRRRPAGDASIVFVPIDATAFPDGGVLKLTVRVGATGTPIRFELCAPGAKHSVLVPVGTLPRIAPGATARLEHAFEKGTPLGIAVLPVAGGLPEDVTAYLATVEVKAR